MWTIDLAHLLRRFGLGVVFLTTMLGANPEYTNELFYAENMAADERRVQRLFQVPHRALRRCTFRTSGYRERAINPEFNPRRKNLCVM